MSMRVVTVLAILLALVAAAALRWGVSRWQSQPKAPLELSLSVSKESFLVGEPVKIQMQVRNETKDELKLQFHLGFGCTNDLSAAISSDEGKTFQPYTSMATLIGQREFCLVPPFTLKSGEERKGEEFISFHVVSVDFMTNKVEGDFAFPKAGKYQVKMTLTPRPLTGILESNVVEVEVVEPEGKDNEALQFIVGHQLKPFLTPEARLFPVTDETVQKLQEFLEQFKGSTYAPYVQLGLEAICRGREQEFPACQK